MAPRDGFKPYHQGQTLLLPLSVEDFVPAGHKARVISAVVDQMDLSVLYSSYCTDNGQNAYDPRMLTKVLFYATFMGVFSSREIEHRLHTDTAFMYLAALQKPSYRTIVRFRTRFFAELVPLFQQIVQICQDLDLVGLNHIAFDGSKIKANASPKKTKTAKQLEKRIRKLLKLSIQTDEEEDEIFAAGSPFFVPEELADDPDLLQKIEQLANAHAHLQESGEKRINLTDGDAHVMKSKQLLLPAYNLQTAVDEKAHVIVAAEVTTDETDYAQLVPLVEQAMQNTGGEPAVISADPGYATYENYEYLQENGIYALIPDAMHFIDTHGRPKFFPKARFRYSEEDDRYCCPAGRTLQFVRTQNDAKNQPRRLYRGNCSWCPLHRDCTKAASRAITRHPKEALKEEMRRRLATPAGKDEYAKRITVAEAPFGNVKYNKRWTQLSHRGLNKAKGECLLHVIGHNLGVICRHASVELIKGLNPIRTSSEPGGWFDAANCGGAGTGAAGAGCGEIGMDQTRGCSVIGVGFAM